MKHSVDYRVVLVGAIAMLLFALRFLRFDHSPPAVDATAPVADAAAPAPLAVETPQAQEPASGYGAGFIPARPVNNSIRVIASNGQYCANAVRVAVRNEFHDLQYLSGTDPAAVKYLADTRAAEQKLTMDYGPANADTSSLPPPGVSQAKRVEIAGGNK
jgi:hypothetical protein